MKIRRFDSDVRKLGLCTDTKFHSLARYLVRADLHSCNADQFVTDLAEQLAKQKDLSLITGEMGPDISLLGLEAGKPVGSWSGLPSGVFAA